MLHPEGPFSGRHSVPQPLNPLDSRDKMSV